MAVSARTHHPRLTQRNSEPGIPAMDLEAATLKRAFDRAGQRIESPAIVDRLCNAAARSAPSWLNTVVRVPIWDCAPELPHRYGHGRRSATTTPTGPAGLVPGGLRVGEFAG